MKKHAQYVDFIEEMHFPNSVYRAIVWYLEDWIWRQDYVTVVVRKSSAYDGYIVEVTTEYDTWWNIECIKLYEENGNFIFEKTSNGMVNDGDSEWYSTLAPMKVSIPVKSSGYRVFAKFLKEYHETHKVE